MRFGVEGVPQDILSGSRAFYRSDLLEWPIRSKGFGIETELTTLALKQDFNICEYPVRYTPRTKQDGKKIRFYHLFVCALAALRHYYDVPDNYWAIPHTPWGDWRD
ncbi:hypothetical protein GW860_03510 [bacterium]|nr:hypothetical protein [bacterium]